MAENKKGFVLYCDLIHTIKKLPDEKAGQLFKHILSYVNDENPKTDDLIIDLTFEPIKQQLKRDLNKWEEIRLKRSESGKLGGLKRAETFKQNEANQANATFAKQNEANQAVIVTVKDKVKDIVIVNDNVINNNKSDKPILRFVIPEISEIKDYCFLRKNNVDAETFYNFYQSKGWMVGKSKMKDWKACIHTWEKSNTNQTNSITNGKRRNNVDSLAKINGGYGEL
jgi:hypothetical protein